MCPSRPFSPTYAPSVMSLVADASLVVAGLLNLGPEGEWAENLLASDALVAPHHMPAEVAAALRRKERASEISQNVATVAFTELLTMDIEFHAFEPLATRIWQLRHVVTVSDAWYVALAEALEVPLATIDFRLTHAPGPRCSFVTPPGP